MDRRNEKKANNLHLDADFDEAVKLLAGRSKILDNILDSMGDGLSIQDRKMRIVYQNRFMVDNFGENIGEHCYEIYENRNEVCEGCPIQEAYRTGKVTRVLRMGTTKEGEKFRFENIASLLRNDLGETVAGMELVRLVEDRERALDELREAVEKLMQAKAVYENSSEGIMVVDHNNRIVSVNPAFESITGYSAEEVQGTYPIILNCERQPADFYSEEILRSLNDTGTWRGEIWSRHKDGHSYALLMTIDTILDEGGEVRERVCVFSDITEKKLMEQHIEHMAQHDALTSLPNRMLFSDRLEHAMAVAKREKQNLALLYIDLDHFKPVNDNLGHTAGDTLLQIVARRMSSCVREVDTMARMGGDEFAVILAPVKSQNDILLVAEKIRTALEAPFEIDGNHLEISCSIGCAMYPKDGLNEEVLTQNADRAMYKAKKRGRNKVCFADAAK